MSREKVFIDNNNGHNGTELGSLVFPGLEILQKPKVRTDQLKKSHLKAI